MHLHKFLMGYRWDELPAETVLDHKVSVIIGNTLGISLLLNGILLAALLAKFEQKNEEPKK